jgi:hypothetical protein
LIRIELHPVGIADRLSRLQTQHQLMRPGVFLLQIVTIIRAGQRNPEFLVDFNQAGIGHPLMIKSVRLHLEIKMIPAKDLLKFAGHRHGTVHVFLADEIRNFTTQAAGQGDNAFMM